jgi:hypothetical protein
MVPHFARRDDRVIDVELGDGLRLFTEALLDAVSTRAPKGSDGINPSTYWIDRTLATLYESKPDATGLIATGNAWDLIVENADIVARSQYEVGEPERLSVEQFIDTLVRWRDEVTRERERPA